MDMNEIRDTLVYNLKYQMRREGWSVSRLAESSGVAVSTLNRILSGKGSPKVETLIMIAQTMGVDINVFFSGINTEKETTYIWSGNRRSPYSI